MKIRKVQLKEMVRQVVRKKLQEMDAVSIEGDNNGRMGQDEFFKHLESEKEMAQQKRARQQRQVMKQTTHGMELECGTGNREVEGEKVLDDEEEECLGRLERLILQCEKKRQV